MAIATYPTASSGGIKSVQRGQAVSSGNIAITSVDTAKTFVRSISEGASGTVATNSTNAAYNSTVPEYALKQASGQTTAGNLFTYASATKGPYHVSFTDSHTITGNTSAMSGGTMDATTKQFGVYLSNSTTLVATGACRWEVVEFA